MQNKVMPSLFQYSAKLHTSYELFFRVFRHYLLFILLCFCSGLAWATEVKQVQISLHDEHYLLTTEVDYQLTDKAKEALENGVPLYWTLHVKVMRQRDFFWDKTLVDTAINYRLQYHALLNMYRVVIVHTETMKGDSYNFSTLSAALDLMASLRNFPVIDKSAIAAEKSYYYIEIKANFERDALPLPLRPIAYTNTQWYLSSDWTVWPLKK